MKLSKNFDLTEFVKTETGNRLGIDNTPPADVAEKLRTLCEQVLQPLRDAYGSPLTINSGYRCPELNRAVGGASTSQHLKGEAADITAGSVAENKHLFELAKSLPFDQLIWERGGAWVHISYRAGGGRKQVLKIG